MIDLLIANPFRPLDAWWQRATIFHSSGGPSPSGNRDSWRGNSWIRRAVRFLEALKGVKTPQDEMTLIAEHSAIYYARRLQDDDLRMKRIRATIEARILARQSDEEIGKANGCWPQYIEAYEALFFNVRSRLNHRDFVLNVVVGHDVAGNADAHDDGLLLRRLGYLGGPHVVDSIVSHYPSGGWAKKPEGVAAFFHDMTINAVKEKAAIAAMAIPVDENTHRRLLNGFVKVMKIESTTKSASGGGDQLQEGLDNLLSAFPFTKAGQAKAQELGARNQEPVASTTEQPLQAGVGEATVPTEEFGGWACPEPQPLTAP